MSANIAGAEQLKEVRKRGKKKLGKRRKNRQNFSGRGGSSVSQEEKDIQWTIGEKEGRRDWGKF